MRICAYLVIFMDKLLYPFKALADETRLCIINILIMRECCVCEVMQALDISQTRASRNLGILHEAGFLKLRKDGLWSLYSLKASPADYHTKLAHIVNGTLKDNPQAKKDLKRLNRARRSYLLPD
jgi:ArsR family transcriptional regulator